MCDIEFPNLLIFVPVLFASVLFVPVLFATVLFVPVLFLPFFIPVLFAPVLFVPNPNNVDRELPALSLIPELGGDFMGPDVGGDVMGPDVGGDFMGPDVGGDFMGPDVGGDFLSLCALLLDSNDSFAPPHIPTFCIHPNEFIYYDLYITII